MKIFPAIDIRAGRVVRLTQGDYGRTETYGIDPCEAARGFAADGAQYLHVVDLDGAKDGELSNFDTIREIITAGGLFTEVGGGIRDEARIVRYLEAGVGRVILGTAAVNNFPFLCEMVRRYGERIAVGVDARDGRVAVDGWQTTTALDSVAFCRQLLDVGVRTVIYTDISRDGAMKGTNLAIHEQLLTLSGLEIVASGGVSSLDDILALRDLGVPAAIVGKALYTGALRLSEVLGAAKGGRDA